MKHGLHTPLNDTAKKKKWSAAYYAVFGLTAVMRHQQQHDKPSSVRSNLAPIISYLAVLGAPAQPKHSYPLRKKRLIKPEVQYLGVRQVLRG